MNVRELRQALLECPDDALVVLSSDAEGNSYSPLAAITKGYYEPECTWSGEFHEHFVAGDPDAAVCLEPVN